MSGGRFVPATFVGEVRQKLGRLVVAHPVVRVRVATTPCSVCSCGTCGRERRPGTVDVTAGTVLSPGWSPRSV